MRTHILSINGNNAMNYLIKTGFSDKYKVITVANVFEAWQELNRNQKIQMILVDVDYQTEECVDFVQHLNSSTMYSCPVIILGSSQNREIAERLGSIRDVRELFIKPFNPINLSKSIDGFVSLNLA